MILVNVTTKDDKEEAVCFNQFSFYIGGGGGFGGKRHSDHAKSLVATPSRSPDASIQEKTSCCQALWYRLSGDYNPIHIEPEFAQMGGKGKGHYCHLRSKNSFLISTSDPLLLLSSICKDF